MMEKSNYSNPLKAFSTEGQKLLPVVRKEICKSLGWSEPTYFRKLRQGGLQPGQEIVIMMTILSNLERLGEIIQQFKPAPPSFQLGENFAALFTAAMVFPVSIRTRFCQQWEWSPKKFHAFILSIEKHRKVDGLSPEVVRSLVNILREEVSQLNNLIKNMY